MLPKLPGSSNELQLTLQGSSHEEVETITAYLQKKDAEGKDVEETIGKLNLISYNKLNKTLVLVPVNNTTLPIDASSLQLELNKIYSPAVVQWQVSIDTETALNSNYDLDNNGLEYGTSGLFSNYTSEMRTIINDYSKKHPLASDTYYLFLVPEASDIEIKGYMPRKKQAGFIFTDQLSGVNLTKTIAHELAHGAFRLEHTFPELPENGNNLMDYSSTGTQLHKHQWDNIHDPVVVLGLFEGDEDGAAMSLPCLGIFDDCDDVLRVLQRLKEAGAAGEELIARMPTDKKTRKEANSVKIKGVEYNKIALIYEGEPNARYYVKPKDYLDFNADVLLSDGKMDNQQGFAFKFGERIVAKILVYETSEKMAEKKEALRKYLFGDIPTEITALIQEIFKAETLTTAEIKDIREMIAKVEDEEKRKELYIVLQTKVPYHNQRDNNQDGEVADRMCNLTSLAACFEMLGISNPDPTVQFEDYLEKKRVDNEYALRTKAESWQSLAEDLGLDYQYIGLGSSDQNFLRTKLLPHLEVGNGVMLSISENKGHIVRLQGISASGLIVDDPYGKLTDFAAREAGTGNDYDLNDRTSSTSKGNNNLWTWDNLKSITLKYAYIFKP